MLRTWKGWQKHGRFKKLRREGACAVGEVERGPGRALRFKLKNLFLS